MKKQASSAVDRLARWRFRHALGREVSNRLLVDATTGLPNHFAFELFYERCRRQGRTPAVIEVDIRGFGRFNERRGGLRRGNEILANFASELRGSLKADDFVARWSIGDEFIIAAVGVQSRNALARLCERLEGPFVVRWGRRRRVLRCYAVGMLTRGMSLEQVERVLHERLRRKKVAAKASARIETTQPAGK
jgi:GGDEF domain-containing protein